MRISRSSSAPSPASSTRSSSGMDSPDTPEVCGLGIRMRHKGLSSLFPSFFLRHRKRWFVISFSKLTLFVTIWRLACSKEVLVPPDRRLDAALSTLCPAQPCSLFVVCPLTGTLIALKALVDCRIPHIPSAPAADQSAAASRRLRVRDVLIPGAGAGCPHRTRAAGTSRD